jgi:hypothetical protein
MKKEETKEYKFGYECGRVLAIVIMACLCALLGVITIKVINWLWLL